MAEVVCLHEEFEAHCDVVRLRKVASAEVKAFVLEASVHCSQCGRRFEFLGIPVGLDPDKAGVSPDRMKLRVPLVPGVPTPKASARTNR